MKVGPTHVIRSGSILIHAQKSQYGLRVEEYWPIIDEIDT